MLALDSEVITVEKAQVSHSLTKKIIEELKEKLNLIQNSKLCPELTEFREEIYNRSKTVMDLKQNQTFAEVMNPEPFYNMDFEQLMNDDDFMNQVEMIKEENLRFPEEIADDEAPVQAYIDAEVSYHAEQEPVVCQNQFVQRFNMEYFEHAVA